MRKFTVIISLLLTSAFCTIGHTAVQVSCFGPKDYIQTGLNKPTVYKDTFTVSDQPGPGKLVLTNNGENWWQRIRHARIWLNGKEIFSLRDFLSYPELLEADIELQETNQIVAMIWGRQGSMSVQVFQSYPESINRDTTWGGDIRVNSTVVVEPGVRLTVLPGSKLKFSHYRGYREPERRIHFIIEGSITAEGTSENPIYFTSDAEVPQNGDWSMLRLLSPSDVSIFRYCVFEFAQQGLNVWQGGIILSNCVFRWNNWEGVYFESYCEPILESCLIYENGYNGLAAEQSNNILMDYCEIWRNGTNGVHIDNSTGEVRRSHIHDNGAGGLSVDDSGILLAYGDAIYGNGCGIGVGEGSNYVEVGNLEIYDNGENYCGPVTTVSTEYMPPPAIDIGFTPDQSHALGYIPGDPQLDRYMYIYPDDETRRVVNKIGEGLGLTWSLGWDGEYIWTCTLWNHVYKFDPQSGEVLEDFTLSGSSPWGAPSQPWGMTFDDEGFMWLVDFAERKVFKVDPSTGSIVFSFDTPNPGEGGCKGIAWDGNYLNVLGWASPTIYQMTKTGNLENQINLDHGGGGGLAWDGEYFWVPAARILRYDTAGKLSGWIYAASEGTWDMTWDGTYLWASQRTNENWMDDKIFALEILQIQEP